MKMQSTDKPEVYAVSGRELRVHWNIEQVTREGMDGETETFWQANEALCIVSDTRNILIEKIIGSIYSIAAEIATINSRDSDPEEYAAYQAFRDQAKALADGWLSGR